MSWESFAERSLGSLSRRFASDCQISYQSSKGLGSADLAGRASARLESRQLIVDGAEVEAQGEVPVLSGRLSDLPGGTINRDDVVSIDGHARLEDGDYAVREVKHDGQGGFDADLEAVA